MFNERGNQLFWQHSFFVWRRAFIFPFQLFLSEKRCKLVFANSALFPNVNSCTSLWSGLMMHWHRIWSIVFVAFPRVNCTCGKSAGKRGGNEFFVCSYSVFSNANVPGVKVCMIWKEKQYRKQSSVRGDKSFWRWENGQMSHVHTIY